MKQIGDLIKQIESVSPRLEKGDYIGEDGMIYCGTCRKPKQCKITAFGKDLIVPCLCRCGAERQRRVLEEIRESERRKRNAELKAAGLPNPRFEEWTFEADDQSNEKISRAMRRYVENWQQMKEDGQGLLLYGNVGTGKTFYASCIANALLDKGIGVIMSTFPTLAESMGNFHSRQTLEQLQKVPLLIIDDLGAERNSEYMLEQVYTIVDTRYKSGLPLIVTTNIPIDEIKKPINRAYSRIYDRVLEMCHPVKVDGASRRRNTVKDNFAHMNGVLGL